MRYVIICLCQIPKCFINPVLMYSVIKNLKSKHKIKNKVKEQIKIAKPAQKQYNNSMFWIMG